MPAGSTPSLASHDVSDALHPNIGTGRAPGPSAWRFIVPPALTLLILLVFMAALDAGFVDWDDDYLIDYNTHYRTLSAESLRWMFTTSFGGHFQPLTWLTHTLDWTLWRGETFGYHLTSVLLHAFTSVAFYFVVRRLLALAGGNSGATRSSPVVLCAAFAAALFAVHPLRVESVAWLAERRDVLAGFFYVLGVAFYLRYAAQDRSRSARAASSAGWWSYGAAIAACALSLLAKASAVTLPVVLLILDIYPLRRWRFGGGSRPLMPSARRVWIEKIPFFVLAAAAGVRAVIAQSDGGALYSLTEHDLWARCAQATYGLTFYVWKTLSPTNLGPLYEIPAREVLFGRMLWISLAVTIVGGVAVARTRRHRPAIAAVFAAYVVILFPVLGFLQSGPQLVADRYSYLSCMGFAVLAGGGLLRLLSTRRGGRGSRLRPLFALPAAVLIAGLARATDEQAKHWLAPHTLWKRGVQISPRSAIAHTNYADSLVSLALPAAATAAARHYERALELNENDPVALHHFADLHNSSGSGDKAIGLYIKALRIDPNRQRACSSLARLLLSRDRAGEAVEVLRDGARRHPDALDMIGTLATILCTHPDERVRDAEEAVKWALHVSMARTFSHAPSELTLATAYAEAGRFDEAVQTAEHAVGLARRAGDLYLVNELQRRAKLFRGHERYR
jgi:tetratricopeptide (TPR) repeat protein